jgi:hypothetical protein
MRPPASNPLPVVPIDDPPDVLPADPPRRVVLEVLPASEQAPPVAVQPLPDALPALPGLRDTLRPFYWMYTAFEWAFGIPCLIVALAVLSVIPVVQFVTLGYLLEVSGRIARTARWRDRLPRGLTGFGLYLGQLLLRLGSCFIGVRQAARLGYFVLGAWLLLLPLRFVSSYALSAQLIDPDGPTARAWRIGLIVLTMLTAALILPALFLMLLFCRALAAWWHGEPFVLLGRLRHGYSEARDAVWEFVVSLRLPYYLWLGFRGLFGTLAWLVVPITLIVLGRLIGQQGTQQAGGVGFLVGFAGAVMLMFVVVQLPFLQVRFAAENRFLALFEWDRVVRQFCRAPLAFAIACIAVLVFALPLYLLKIEVGPREATEVPGQAFLYQARLLLLDETLFTRFPELVFIVFILPARVLSGWAYARSVRCRFRWWNYGLIPVAFATTLPVVAFYVLAVFLSQYTSWKGLASLYEQHAFLLPVPFVGM